MSNLFSRSSLRANIVTVAMAAFFLAACGGDGNKANEPDPSAEADFVVDSFDDLSVCIGNREGATAYVKNENNAYICTNGDWAIDTNADTRKKSSSSKDEANSSNIKDKVKSSSSRCEDCKDDAKSSNSKDKAKSSSSRHSEDSSSSRHCDALVIGVILGAVLIECLIPLKAILKALKTSIRDIIFDNRDTEYKYSKTTLVMGIRSEEHTSELQSLY